MPRMRARSWCRVDWCGLTDRARVLSPAKRLLAESCSRGGGVQALRRTRRKYVHVGSSAASMPLKVRRRACTPPPGEIVPSGWGWTRAPGVALGAGVGRDGVPAWFVRRGRAAAQHRRRWAVAAAIAPSHGRTVNGLQATPPSALRPDQQTARSACCSRVRPRASNRATIRADEQQRRHALPLPRAAAPAGAPLSLRQPTRLQPRPSPTLPPGRPRQEVACMALGGPSAAWTPLKSLHGRTCGVSAEGHARRLHARNDTHRGLSWPPARPGRAGLRKVGRGNSLLGAFPDRMPGA